MSKTLNKFSPEVRDRAVRMVFSHEGDYPSRWAAVVSISGKIGCVPQTLNEWVKKAEVDSGQRAGVPTEVADKLKVDLLHKSGEQMPCYAVICSKAIGHL